MKKTIKNAERLRRILAVLVKYGLGHFVYRLHLKEYIPFMGADEGKETGSPRGVRIRKAFEELGPTFVKFGQVLSLRSDILPDDVVSELKKLQDTVPPFPVEDVKKMILEEFGSPAEELYGSFNEEPLAAASIGQVHRAALKDGTDVIVKVQRPSIEEVIRTDLDIMHWLAGLLQGHVPEARHYDPEGLVDEFEKSILRELDFVIEGRNEERFRENFSGDPRVHVPPVINGLTKRKVLTACFSTGQKVSELKDRDYPYRHEIAKRINDLYIIQILDHGFFHADPHPGNIFVMGGGEICFHDFGIVGEIDEETREYLTDLFVAFVEMDMDGIVDTYLNMGVIEEEIDREAFKRDISGFISAYYRLPMKDFSFAEVMGNIIRIGKKYRIKVKRELLLLGKTFMGVESIVRGLDPEFNLVENIRPYASGIIIKQLTPSISRGNIYKALRDLNRLSRTLPDDAVKIIRNLSEKGLELKLRHERLEKLEEHIDKASNRLSFSLIIAAIIVGSSIIMQIHIGPSIGGVPILGAGGYLVALFLGFWLVWSIFRSGRL